MPQSPFRLPRPIYSADPRSRVPTIPTLTQDFSLGAILEAREARLRAKAAQTSVRRERIRRLGVAGRFAGALARHVAAAAGRRIAHAACHVTSPEFRKRIAAASRTFVG